MADRSDVYRTIALRGAARILSALDRGDASLTAGSFDREHWAWKFRDFPLTMLQTGLLPLVELHAGKWDGNPFYSSGRLKQWIVAGLWNTLRRQHRNGAFDSVSPFTQDHGVTLAMAYVMASTVTRLGHENLPADLVSAIRDGVRRACQFASRSSEDYAFISNHQSLFALAWLRASVLLGDEALLERADRTVATILSHQSSEGWYDEYSGADGGYESLGITYLAEYYEARPTPALLESLNRALAFLAYAVHPDGSLGGLYGSRFTSLWYPAGCEQLGATSPLADCIAGHIARHLNAGQVVTPDNVDITNLPLLVWAYLRAAQHCSRRASVAPDDLSAVKLPSTDFQGVRAFAESGLVIAGTPTYYGVFNARRGGVGVVHSRQTGRLAYQDAGYVAQDSAVTWTSALPPGHEAQVTVDGANCRLESSFGQALNTAMGPLRFLALRTMSLTIFRWPAIARFVTRAIVSRLLTRRRAVPIRFVREIRFDADRIVFRDSIRALAGAPSVRLLRARSFQPTHMGSAGYFHPRDLDGIGPADDRFASEAFATMGKVDVSYALVFDANGLGSLESVEEVREQRSAPTNA